MRKPNKEALTLAKHISFFINNYAPQFLSQSKNTLKSYKTALYLYIVFLESSLKITQADISIDVFNKSNIEKWIMWLKDERKCKDDSINVRLASLRTFLKYLSDKDKSYMDVYIESLTIPHLKTAKRKIKGMSKKAIKALLATPNVSTKTGRRDLNIMILLYSLALRIDELLSLKLKDIHLDNDNPFINIIGKGNKIRTMYIMNKNIKFLKKYINEFHGLNYDMEEYLFFSKSKGKYTKLTQPAIAKQLKKYALAAHNKCDEVPLDLHAHQFRHARASHWLQEGINIVQISFLLGHANLETTMVYLDVTDEDIEKALYKLQDEEEKKIEAKWKNNECDLASLFGLK